MQFGSGLFIGDKIWSIELESGRLVSVCPNNGFVFIEKNLVNGDNEDGISYEMLCLIDDNQILVAPFLASDFILYNLHTREIQHILIDWEREFSAYSQYFINERKIGGLIRHDKYIYAIGYAFFGMIRFCCETFEYTTMCFDHFFPMIKPRISCFISKSALLFDEKIIMPLAGYPSMVIYSTEDRQVSMKVFDGIDGIASMCICKNHFFAIDFDNTVMELGKDFSVLEEMKFGEDSNEKQLFAKIIGNKKSVFLFPFKHNELIKYDIMTKRNVVLRQFCKSNRAKFIDVINVDENLFAFEFSNLNLFIIKQNGNCEEVPLDIPSELAQELMEKRRGQNIEECKLGLKRYIQIISE